MNPASVSTAPAARPQRVRAPRRAIHGVLLLDKPRGLTSQDAVTRVRRLTGAEKGGHAGTLDPLADGLLVVCLGAATKFSASGLDADKTYEALLRLGQTTASFDAETPVLDERPLDGVTSERIAAVCAALQGEQEQLPPMYSALKKDGQPLYELARQGLEVERTPRRITLHEVTVLDLQMPLLRLRVRCSKGTYIRSLAHDIGQQLGCGAHLAGLRRVASGDLEVASGVTLEQLEGLAERPLPQWPAGVLRGVDTLIQDAPVVRLDDAESGRFLSGLRRRTALPDRERVRVYGPQPAAFLGMAHIRARELIPDRLLSPPEVQAVLDQAPRPA
ncbi:tRNA pseudouridine(55) synthase TruB [Amphibiibacter pelophylacis]|uniref:tRNA pseudouridine(55) synthase TruB n=1 Tax=Amphibiibacter pelophylacis TaxID=1799477 RepID=A0ACC6P163_9BURK